MSTPSVKRICGFGHPLLDIVSHVDDVFLGRYSVELGSCNLAQESQLPIFEDLSQRRDVEFVPGGACMNTMRVARWVLQKDLVTFVGALGDDEFGCILERALHHAGVRSHFQRIEDRPTGTCACLVVERERSLLANLSAALQLSMDHMTSPFVQHTIQESHFFYCEGFFLNLVSSPDSSLHIGEHCVQYDKRLMWNLSAPYLCHIFKERLAAILPFVDYLFGSRIDYIAYAESMGWDASNINEVLGKIVNLPKRNPSFLRVVIMTDGSAPTVVATGNSSIQEYPTLKVPIDEIVDTNGAGDAFCGGFIAALAHGHTAVESCVRWGQHAAADVIRHDGCTVSETPPQFT